MDALERLEILEAIESQGLAVQALEDAVGGTGRTVIWTVAGSDSGGGAGIQADLKVFQALGLHGCSVLTAVTAQNSLGVEAVHPLSARQVKDQWLALQADLPPAAVKVGIPGRAASIRFLAEQFCLLDVPKVIDPVAAASAGGAFLDREASEAFRSMLLPYADVLTPNLPEAEALLGRPLPTPEAVEEGAREILSWGPGSVVIKGGHRDGAWCRDYWSSASQHAWLTSPRQDTPHHHGTGCAFASALASARALGYHDLDAVVLAKAYINQALTGAYAVGSGAGTLAHSGWPVQPGCLPLLSDRAGDPESATAFPAFEMDRPEIYPVVDRAEWVRKLVQAGLRTLQIRVKDLEGKARDHELADAVTAARETGAHLFVNDDWQAALRLEAYGVHLGQDDLEGADLKALAAAGLRLGISTHSYTELARALACRPSYVALGTLFHTDSKVMDYPPLGLAAFERMTAASPVPVVAIGGIQLDKAPAVLAAGAAGLAMISAITQSENLEQTLANWSDLLAAAEAQGPTTLRNPS